MMWWLALGSGWESLQGGITLVERNLWESLQGGQNSGGMKFVQQVGWENDKNGPKNAELEDREPGG